MDVLSKDPGIVKRQKTWSRGQKSPLVNNIIKAALGDWYETPQSDTAVATTLSTTDKPTMTTDAVSNTAKTPAKIRGKADTKLKPDEDADIKAGVAGRPVVQETAPRTDEAVKGQPQEELMFDFDALIPPEIWEDVMPVSKESQYFQ